MAGGFNFSQGQLVQEVPSDPDVCFSGEDVALAARASTHGYDVFYPNENVIWHLYAHGAPKNWTDTRRFIAIHEQAMERMRTPLICATSRPPFVVPMEPRGCLMHAEAGCGADGVRGIV